MKSSLKVIVAGLVGLYPVGGVAWDYLQYVIGLSRLGHEVYYHEDTWAWPYHPLENTHTADGTYSASSIRHFFDTYAPELSQNWHYVHLHDESYGMSREAFREAARSADIFLNVSGASILPEELSPDCITVFLDTDPGYNQIMLSEQLAWSENVTRWCAEVSAHRFHFTYAENIHGQDCLVPRLDFHWRTTRMPVVLDLWDEPAASSPPPTAPWTTVMTWNAFKGKLVYDGHEYGSKAAEFEKILPLPQQANLLFQVAVGGQNAPLQRLAAAGWNVVDGPGISRTPDGYQDFIAASRGEVSIAKHVYVALKSGWFSCRSACYLAGGRPVVVQDTGFAGILPTGLGILAFTSMDEAIASLQEVEADYERHRRAAREMAHAYFSAETVLARLLDDMFATEHSGRA